MKEALTTDGIICSQAGSVWANLDTSIRCYNNSKNVFCNAAYAFASVPSYPSGIIGFVLGSKNSVSLNFNLIKKILP